MRTCHVRPLGASYQVAICACAVSLVCLSDPHGVSTRALSIFSCLRTSSCHCVDLPKARSYSDSTHPAAFAALYFLFHGCFIAFSPLCRTFHFVFFEYPVASTRCVQFSVENCDGTICFKYKSPEEKKGRRGSF